MARSLKQFGNRGMRIKEGDWKEFRSHSADARKLLRNLHDEAIEVFSMDLDGGLVALPHGHM